MSDGPTNPKTIQWDGNLHQCYRPKTYTLKASKVGADGTAINVPKKHDDVMVVVVTNCDRMFGNANLPKESRVRVTITPLDAEPEEKSPEGGA